MDVPHATYQFAKPLIAKQLEAHGQKELRERWKRYEKLATAFVLEALDTAGGQPLDGFIPHDFFVKGVRHYFEIADEDLGKIMSASVQRMRQILSNKEEEEVLLFFPDELFPFFEEPKSAGVAEKQTDRQNALGELVLKKLKTIFNGFKITFRIGSKPELQREGSYLRVKFTNDPQTDDSILGITKTKDLPSVDWLKGVPGGI